MTACRLDRGCGEDPCVCQPAAKPHPRTLLGRDVSPETDWRPSREESLWIGKPWRRVELLTQRHYYKGEQDATRDLSFHLGFRRLGLGFTFSITKASYLDYSEEPNQ